jgi:hypothetical protein
MACAVVAATGLTSATTPCVHSGLASAPREPNWPDRLRPEPRSPGAHATAMAASDPAALEAVAGRFAAAGAGLLAAEAQAAAARAYAGKDTPTAPGTPLPAPGSSPPHARAPGRRCCTPRRRPRSPPGSSRSPSSPRRA